MQANQKPTWTIYKAGAKHDGPKQFLPTLTDGEGIKIDIALKEFNILDFPKADMIYKRGYDRAMQMIDSIKCSTKKRTMKASRQLSRSIFKSHTPKFLSAV